MVDHNAPRKRTCADCAELRSTGALERRDHGGPLFWICSECSTGARRVRLGPERGYQPSGGLLSPGVTGNAFRRVVPKAVRMVDLGHAKEQMVAARTAGWILVRVRRLPGLDSDLALASLRNEPWFNELKYLGASLRYFLFQRPDPKYRRAEEFDIAVRDLERHRSTEE